MSHIVTQGYFDVPEHVSSIILIFYTLLELIIALWSQEKHENPLSRPLCGPFGPYKGKWVKNVIFHDFFKLLLNGLGWYCRYVEMLLGSQEGILSPRIHFWPVSSRQQTKAFPAQIEITTTIFNQNSQKCQISSFSNFFWSKRCPINNASVNILWVFRFPERK